MGNIDDLYRKYTVKVNTGSGCLFQPDISKQPKESKFTYVLTAKHCLEKNDSELEKEEIEVLREIKQNEFVKLNVLDVYRHEHKDAAILKVDYVDDNISLCHTSYQRSDSLRFFGYPFRRKDYEIKTAGVDCTVDMEHQDKRIEIVPNKTQFCYDRSAHENIKGFSGCGVFKEVNDAILLVGILSRLADPSGAGDNILILPIDYFKEIISQYNGLVPLIPRHLASFEDYKKKIWDGFDSELNGSRNLLEKTADEVIRKNLTPMLICELAQDKLFVPYKSDWVNDSDLWSGWLELLTYNKIENEEIKSNDQQLELLQISMENKRFFYNNTVKEWISLVRKILKLDLKELKKGACIIVNTICRYTPPKTKLDSSRIIKEIDRAQIYRSDMRVDEGIDPAKDFTFIHLLEFKKRIFDNGSLSDLGYGDEDKITEELKKSIKLAYKNE